MKVALVTQLFPPEFAGGTERVVRAQARGLAARGHEVLVVCGSEQPHEGRDVAWDRHGRIEVARLPRKLDEPFDLALARPRLERVACGLVEGCDVAHVHHWTTLSSGLVRALSAETPVVVTLHDAFSACPRSFRSPPDPGVRCPQGVGHVPCVRCLLPDAGGLDEPELVAGLRSRAEAFAGEIVAASAVLAPSRFQARRMEAVLGLTPGTVEVLPHGLCRALGRPAERSAPWDGRRPLRVLHFGHLVEAKGILDLVRSLASLERGAVELDLAGAVLEPGLEEAVRATSGALQVRWHGAYSTRALAALAAEADLAAFPSRLEETYGLVVDEAAALGLPAWVSDRGALPERTLDLDGGRVLPAEEPEAWSAAFAELLARPQALGESRARVVAPPGPEAAVTRLEELYRGLSRTRT